ncbi:hypothetical protein ACNKHK_27040 [Shigella flexneri]
MEQISLAAPAGYPSAMGRFTSGFPHRPPGCGAFHRAHQALFTHHLLECSDSDWGICEVNLMPGTMHGD